MRKRVGPRRMEGDRDPHSVQAPLLSPSLLFGVMVLVYVLTAVAQPVSPPSSTAVPASSTATPCLLYYSDTLNCSFAVRLIHCPVHTQSHSMPRAHTVSPHSLSHAVGLLAAAVQGTG